ncbi:MAG: dihydrolipoyl dehydrogenase family protein [Alphaproteobacteria bacterium]
MLKTDICVIGAGSGGLSVAVAAVQMGAEVVLIERDKMGGDCLNSGCVPSKALLHASKHPGQFKTMAKTQQYVQSVIDTIAPHDSVERMEGLGIHVIKQQASFISGNTVQAGDQIIRAKAFVIATGSSPAVPPIPGLQDIPYFTNETIFENKKKIDHLLVIGGGPIGLEMAQAHRRLGCDVTVIEGLHIFLHDDPEAAEVVRQQMEADGVKFIEGHFVDNLSMTKDGKITAVAGPNKIDGSHVLVAAGRLPNIEGLDLEAAGVKYDRAIDVNDCMQTSNKNIYAIGDVIGQHQFTHMANYHAGIALKNIIFRVPFKASYHAVPWVTYTEPELAQVGLNESNAQKKLGETLRVLKFDYDDNDRAHTEDKPNGFIKIMADKKGYVHGATIVGRNAGELLLPWSLMIQNRLKLKDLAQLVVAYPTLSEISKRVAGSFYTDFVFGPIMNKIVKLLMRYR